MQQVHIFVNTTSISNLNLKFGSANHDETKDIARLHGDPAFGANWVKVNIAKNDKRFPSNNNNYNDNILRKLFV